ncbi:F-box/kelch-repeat protein SKIP25 [Forsythia ovata]|uniref:F-box/kelch-repeat protein SKIP25 n=1 Tax=Forsythia ovata TaxID=205694 RepID=A0ABD1TN12_9LAMI
MEVEFESVLLPGLPNHLAHLCLSTLHPSVLYRVCRSWQRLIYSPSFPPFFSLYTVLFRPNSVEFCCFDPISSKWRVLPTPPSEPPLSLIRRHPSFISRILPIQSLAVSGRLILISATMNKFLPAFTHPLVFDPLSSNWSFGPPLSNPRRWCVAGSARGAVYIASGVGAQYNGDVARSVEKWDMNKKVSDWNWEKMASLKDGRFSREAVEALEYRGKLCTVNINGKASKDGIVYDFLTNQWEEMSRGMLAGWIGPAAVDGDFMYVVDQENGSLSKYNAENDCWERLINSSEHLKGAEHIAAGGGRVCAVCAGGGKIIVVDILATPAKIWVVSPPSESEVIAVHILPRMTHFEN